ncbi:hypothetical protein C9439_03855 [archaeon SCG-AAA382B04]|nr:hypothetical protein C9439_03855 [archaeon SCG-AAA382B04]
MIYKIYYDESKAEKIERIGNQIMEEDFEKYVDPAPGSQAYDYKLDRGLLIKNYNLSQADYSMLSSHLIKEKKIFDKLDK